MKTKNISNPKRKEEKNVFIGLLLELLVLKIRFKKILRLDYVCELLLLVFFVLFYSVWNFSLNSKYMFSLNLDFFSEICTRLLRG
jgi:hypothetical protein